jgi:hypothetical protein
VAAESTERLYRFEPLDASGIFLGLGVIQCDFVGGGLVASVLALTAGLPLGAAAVPVVTGVAVSFARVRGRAAWEWLPILVSWTWMRASRGERWLARLPLFPADDAALPQLPPPLAGLAIVELPWRGALHLGAIADEQRGTLTALVPVSGPEFVVQPRANQEHLLGGWADVLNQFAVERSVVTHLAWSDFTRPSGLHEHRQWLGTIPRAQPHEGAANSYAGLISEATAVAANHETVLTLTVARDRLPRRSGLHDGPDGPLGRALCGAIEGLLRSIRSAGLFAGDPLDTMGLARLLRTRVDPPAVASRLRDGRLVDRLGAVSRTTAGPLVVESTWRSIRADGSWHRTYWVSCWPRLPVGPAWLEPFLSGGGVARTMTVAYCPVSTYRSRRRIERDLVKLDSDAQTKQDKGRRIDARHRRATQALLDREDELVAGYAEMTYLGLVGVTAPTEEDLESECELVEQLAREVGLELRSLDGRQDLAWAANLPLGLVPSSLLL